MKSAKTNLGYRERDKLFQKYFTEFKIKVTLNWCELIALLAVSFFVSYKLLKFVGLEKITTCLFMAAAASISLTILFSYIRKYKLSINRFDKERIYKRVSNELLEENKDA